ncbi:MAG: YsnF/AvaK domain-containing protein [Syntrophomonas sp.]
MNNEPQEKITLGLKEEQLDIKKDWVQIGEINWHKEVLTEEKNITVPIKREEIVIEQKFFEPESPEKPIRFETIRIPVREERIELNKVTYNLEEVDIYLKRIQQTVTIDEVLKREVLNLKTSGNVNIETK